MTTFLPSGRLLSDEAVAFVTDLQRRFGPRRDELLAARRQQGPPRDFLPGTADVRAATGKPLRRVPIRPEHITGT